DCLRRENTNAAVFAAADHHLGVDRHVFRRREQPRVARDAAEQMSSRVVYVTLNPFSLALLGWRRSRLKSFARQIAGLFHAERPKDVFLRKLMHSLTADAADNLAEQNEIDVGVNESRAGGCLQF